MDKQNKRIYCRDTTENHTIALEYKSCIQKIGEVCKKDGAKTTLFTDDEICLNLDKYEEYKAQNERRNKQKTMDFCIGTVVADNKKKAILLVELKLKCKKPYNLKKEQLEGKIRYSRDILGNTPMILNHYYFIFKRDIKNQAQNHIRRLFNNRKAFFAIDMNELKDEFF